jgi:hypothetical protein
MTQFLTDDVVRELKPLRNSLTNTARNPMSGIC